MTAPIEKMSPEQLEARIRGHESTAAMFERRGDSTNARGFREMANTYRDELKRRIPTPDKSCVQCQGSGRLAGDEYCTCRTGRDLRRSEES